MDTPAPSPQPASVYVQLPANLQGAVDCFEYLHKHGWKPKKYNFYNKQLKIYASVREVYLKFRNNS